MATVTHYIYSHYDPKQREELERATGQVEVENEADPWQTESSFGAQRRLAAAPPFVPATISYDAINDMMSGLSEVSLNPKEEVSASGVSEWYKSLPRSTSAPAADLRRATLTTSTRPSPLPSSSKLPEKRIKRESRTKNNWFITRALRSEPPTSRSTPAPTLADILSREPPPDPADRPFTPPVFLAIGPSNKGFAMLQQSGWREGEALGAGVRRRAPARPSRIKTAEAKREHDATIVKEEEREVSCDQDGDVVEVRKVQVIDLTLSDSEDGDEEEELESSHSDARSSEFEPPPSHNPTALLTPIATVLKSDRLGIGLKAKTVGRYKASKKRVTHNAAALAAHIRESEEMRRKKRKLGRGTRSFARIAKAEAESRKRLLASLNE
ncbi:hypothetical protein A0H81_08765 [Grifola frondosa]|uniref:G-patch domain-containing protein n=1 Tax=Grifola frondosa TaxID=5627 RepID=A0A1C7M4P4_GRIFR|nr:hypothetical protein A0H81_08765 [Grifola frondosa]